ncbi:rod shape-determining protein MreC [Neisseria sp. Ec49-e6-T10]|uniref:rod shape-determining protein MreC n=1 Tax=Neisseria sp. Ec49-e6-T10 TaxID=3140744 RepID=UPI003EB770E2
MSQGFSFNYSNRGTKPVTKLVVFSLLSIGLMIADEHLSLMKGIKSAVLTVLYPIQWAADLPVQAYDHAKIFLTNQSELHEENRKLLIENTELKAKLGTQNTLYRSLAELQALQNIQSRFPAVVTSAQIISTQQDPFSNKLLISKGSSSGVELGQPVIDNHGLLGQVTTVQPYSAEITLLTNSKQVIPVMIERTGERALLYGSGNGVDLRYLSTNTQLQTNDILVTSGLDDVYSPGIPVARIIEATKNIASPFYRTQVVPLAGVNQSRYILVLAKAKYRSASPSTLNNNDKVLQQQHSASQEGA